MAVKGRSVGIVLNSLGSITRLPPAAGFLLLMWIPGETRSAGRPRISSTHNIHLPRDCLHPHVHPEPAVASNTLFAGSRTHQPPPTNLFNESALSAAERTRAGYRRGPGARTLIICVRDQHRRLWWDVAAAPMAVLWCPPPRGPTFYNKRAWKTRRWPNSRKKNPPSRWHNL